MKLFIQKNKKIISVIVLLIIVILIVYVAKDNRLKEILPGNKAVGKIIDVKPEPAEVVLPSEANEAADNNNNTIDSQNDDTSSDIDKSVKLSGVEIYSISKSDISSISYTANDGTTIKLKYNSSDNRWVFEKESGIIISNDKMNCLLGDISTLYSNKIITDADPFDYNFQEPAYEYRITDIQGTINTIKISVMADKDEVYVVFNDDYDNIYVVDSSYINISNYTLEVLSSEAED